MGKKQKAGRKRINPAEKVILVGFYTRKSIIDRIGGMRETREKAKEFIESVAENL